MSLPKEKNNRVEEGLEIVVAIDFRGRVQPNISEDLHPDDGVDEEEHSDQEADIRESLEIL